MGRTVKFSGKRTVLALGLIALAVVVPGAAWYLVGSRELERQITDQSLTAQEEARETAVRLARQLADRFSVLLEAEARRPYFHYQTYFQDPKGGPVALSPLTSGPTDPLVDFYFQVDGLTGKVTLLGKDREDVELVGLLQPQFDPAITTTLSEWRGECQATNETVMVGPLKWRTVYLANKPALVALRAVCPGPGPVLQGFLISSTWVEYIFKSSGVKARFRPGRAGLDYEAAVALGGEPWRVVAHPSAPGDVVDKHGTDLRRAFLTIYIGGVAIAAVAGLGVVWLVWHSDRLARQRVQFAASAAHELRTPLAGLRIYSEMLTDGLGDPGKTRDYSQRIAAEANRLGRVVANLLSFTRFERGVLKARPVAGDLAGTVRDCVERQKLALETVGAKLTTNIAQDLPAVEFDRDAVAEIVENLLDNAEKHTRQAVDRTIELMLTGTAEGVELAVADRGPGVPAELRRHLFAAFARSRDNEAPAGLGLGLVLVKALAEAQGARVTYADNPGGGARFVVTFPR
ncbi:MAG: Adaptive-response sensory-kinase SasA [Verrucomicrobiae bacterium]|nr:Adaptive-response sensory-kinase SasA [Verrucomicrobiae bacterium]